MAGATFKAIALVWASYADPDGTRIFPGDATLAVDCEVDLKLAKTVKAKLIELGLTRRVRAGARRWGGNDEYRLTLPEDLLDRLVVLNPLELRAAADKLKDTSRRKRSNGRRTDDHEVPVQGPVDTEQEDPANLVPGPQDPEQSPAAEVCTGSTGPADPSCTGSTGPDVRGPLDPALYTHHDRPQLLPTNPLDVSTDVAVSRARGPDQPEFDLPAASARRIRADAWMADPTPLRPPPTPDARVEAIIACTARGAALCRRALDEGPDVAPPMPPERRVTRSDLERVRAARAVGPAWPPPEPAPTWPADPPRQVAVAGSCTPARPSAAGANDLAQVIHLHRGRPPRP